MNHAILVAEDDTELRDAIAWSLRADGYKVVTATDGLEALRIMRSGKTELAVLDVRMPWINGLEVVAHMRRDPLLRRIPVVVLTGYPGEVPGDLAMIAKPFSAPRLLQMVRAIVGGPSRPSGNPSGSASASGQRLSD